MARRSLARLHFEWLDTPGCLRRASALDCPRRSPWDRYACSSSRWPRFSRCRRSRRLRASATPRRRRRHAGSRARRPRPRPTTQEDLDAAAGRERARDGHRRVGAVPGRESLRPSRSEEAPPPAAGEPIFQEEGSRPAENARGDENLWRGRVAQARARVDRARQRHQTLAGLHLVPGYEYQDEGGR